MSSELKRPLSVIFLDIDGVLMNWHPLDQVRARIERKAFELFGGGYYTDLQWKTAGSYCFVESAVENLVNLIEEVKKETAIAIVLTSTWRLDRTVDEITNQMFSSRPFSRLIIDKIADDDALRKKRGEEELSPIALAKYGFALENRGAQIDYWLRENYLKLNIKNFVIIDDMDDGLSARFNRNFVKIREFLSPAEVQNIRDVLLKS